MMFNGLKKTVEKNPSDHSWCHHFQSIQKVSIDFFSKWSSVAKNGPNHDLIFSPFVLNPYITELFNITIQLGRDEIIPPSFSLIVALFFIESASKLVSIILFECLYSIFEKKSRNILEQGN